MRYKQVLRSVWRSSTFNSPDSPPPILVAIDPLEFAGLENTSVEGWRNRHQGASSPFRAFHRIGEVF